MKDELFKPSNRVMKFLHLPCGNRPQVPPSETGFLLIPNIRSHLSLPLVVSLCLSLKEAVLSRLKGL